MGLPRTRGDGPRIRRGAARHDRASPHTRGWTCCRWFPYPKPRGFPAHAGMDPPSRSHAGSKSSGEASPHTRGDRRGPRPDSPEAASPHTRGWTAVLLTGFPAHAGMDPCERPALARGLPRTRGDGPIGDGIVFAPPAASPRRGRRLPRTRGDGPPGRWTHDLHVLPLGFPAHAGMDPKPDPVASPHTRGWTLGLTRIVASSSGLPRTRGDGPCTEKAPRRFSRSASPHTRGWTPTPCCFGKPATSRGFPAHAGMDPGQGRRPMILEGFPAHAGMDRRPGFPARGDGRGDRARRLPRTRPRDGSAHATHDRLPRTRGDGPDPASVVQDPPRRSRGLPRTRGDGPRRRGGRRTSTDRLPRTRGDGPGQRPVFFRRRWASPHTRGWTQRRQSWSRGVEIGARAGLPRTRGDGPVSSMTIPLIVPASPHTRGCTVALLSRTSCHTGFPAHAGMDPRRTSTRSRTYRLPRTSIRRFGTSCGRSPTSRRSRSAAWSAPGSTPSSPSTTNPKSPADPRTHPGPGSRPRGGRFRPCRPRG